MRYWMLDKMPRNRQIDCSSAVSLLASLGEIETDALAAEILATTAPVLAACQCTVFAYEFGNRPRVVSVGDRRGGRFLSNVADLYSKLFYSLDGNQRVLEDAACRNAASALVLHRQMRSEIVHEGYRNACYDQPAVADRLALLQQTSAGIWLSVNLYKGMGQGEFSDAELLGFQGLAPLVAQAAKLHYTLVGQHQTGISQLMLARLRARCPQLSKRELDVLRGVLEGQTAVDIGETMGIRPSSVVTYQKRAYRRLGISSQRELFALVLVAGHN